MEVRVRPPITGRVMPVSFATVTTILAMVMTIIASPVVSIHWVNAQTIDNGTGLQVGEGTSGEDGTTPEQGPINGGNLIKDSTNGVNVQESDVSAAGDESSDGTNLGTVNNGDVVDGPQTSVETDAADRTATAPSETDAADRTATAPSETDAADSTATAPSGTVPSETDAAKQYGYCSIRDRCAACTWPITGYWLKFCCEYYRQAIDFRHLQRSEFPYDC